MIPPPAQPTLPARRPAAETGGAAPPGRCPACGGTALGARLDLGEQPLCNRYLRQPAGGEYTHALALGQCGGCGLVRLLDPAPAAELASHFPWIRHREPEEHLDRLVEVLAGLPGVGTAPVVGGVSHKDDSTLERFATRGGRTWRIDPAADLGLEPPSDGIESVQERLDPAAARSFLERHPPADILLVRHILEHAGEAPRFLAALRALVRPGGYLVVEVPDCVRAFERGDCTVIWEEHLLYFTEPTLAAFFAGHGLRPDGILRFPYPFEDSLVAVVPVPGGGQPGEQDAARPAADPGAFGAFAAGLAGQRDRVRALLAGHGGARGEVALLGAGHSACTFVNLLGLADLVSFAADDDPNKAGLFLPGSRLPILPASALLERPVRLCLLAVGASAEGRVAERHGAFLARGGRFASIYPGSPIALAP